MGILLLRRLATFSSCEPAAVSTSLYWSALSWFLNTSEIPSTSSDFKSWPQIITSFIGQRLLRLARFLAAFARDTISFILSNANSTLGLINFSSLFGQLSSKMLFLLLKQVMYRYSVMNGDSG